MKGFEAAYFTRGRNLVLSDTSDMCSPDWGDIYLAAKESWFISEAGLTLYLSEGKREYLRKDCERLYLLAVNTEKLSLARSLSNQRDLNEINRRMQESTGGAFTNFEDYAMALREYTEKANADLESIGTVNAVANGVDVNMSTMTGREADASGEFEVKDEDKYRALEEELGIRKA